MILTTGLRIPPECYVISNNVPTTCWRLSTLRGAKFFCILSFFSRSRSEPSFFDVGRAGAKIFYLELEPNKKISGAGAEEKWLGSSTLVLCHHDTFFTRVVECGAPPLWRLWFQAELGARTFRV